MTSKYVKAEPEYRLIAAYLNRALQDVYEPNSSYNSRGWFFDDTMEPFSFMWCLQLLEMEHLAPKIRKMINENTEFNVGFKSKSHKSKLKQNKDEWYKPTKDTPLKECNMCHQVKLETEFYMRNQNSRWDMCKDCHLEYMRARKLAQKRITSPCEKHQSYQQELRQPQ